MNHKPTRATLALRKQILTLLPATYRELAEKLHYTELAIRYHMIALERQGKVRRMRDPAYVGYHPPYIWLRN